MKNSIFVNNMESKKERVRVMFDSIAPRYDFLNHALSLTIDKRWRARVVRGVVRGGAREVLDVATGTGDLAIGLVKGGVERVVGVDLSSGMVDVGVQKVEKQGLADRIELQVQDVEQLNFEDGRFDAVTCGFGVRNFENLEVGLRQMHRVLRSGGECYVLEFSQVERGLWGSLYGFYFHSVLPLVGRLVSGDRGAYSYLPESVDEFASGEAFLDKMRAAGFVHCQKRELMGGIATIYTARK